MPYDPTQQPAPVSVPDTPKTVQAPSYKPGLTSSTGYSAAPYKVEPQGLVQERVKGIVAEDSPLMQQAATIAAQKANDRGLVNSSMAVGAGQQAVIAQATPIAQQDAAAINDAMTNTANQENAARQFKANASNTAELANQGAINDALKAQQAGSVQLTNTKMTADLNAALANLDSQTKIQLSDMDNTTRALLQTNQSASNAYVQTVQNIAQISQSQTMNAAAKKTAIDNQINLLRQQLATLSNINDTTAKATDLPQSVVDLDLSKYFQTADSPSQTPATATATKTPTAGSGGTGLINQQLPEKGPVYTQPVVTPPPSSIPSGAPAGGGGFGVPSTAPASGTVQNPGGIAGPNTRNPKGQIPNERLVPSGGPPPWPGAIKRGTTTTGGREIYDVYY